MIIVTHSSHGDERPPKPIKHILYPLSILPEIFSEWDGCLLTFHSCSPVFLKWVEHGWEGDGSHGGEHEQQAELAHLSFEGVRQYLQAHKVSSKLEDSYWASNFYDSQHFEEFRNSVHIFTLL